MTCHEIADYMYGIISRGIKITARLLAIHSHNQLVNKIARYLTPCQYLDQCIEESLSTMAQSERREDLNYNSKAKDEAEAVTLLPFSGDTVPPKGPPLAWVLLWGGKFVNIYGGYIPEPLKAFGWVRWDKHRLDNLGVRRLIADQWKTVPEIIEKIQRD